MMSIEATFKWNEKTRILLQKAPEKVLRSIARQTLDYTKSTKVVASSENAPYKIPVGHRSGTLERSMGQGNSGVHGDFMSGFYIGNFTDYACYVYGREGVHWTRGSTQPKWFEYTWDKLGSGIIDTAVKENKI